MSHSQEDAGKRALLQLGDAVLEVVASSKGLATTPEARQALERNLTEFIAQPYMRIFESVPRESSLNFMKGIETVSGSACSMAMEQGREYLSGSDVDNAVQRSFCNVWPFCR